MRRAPAAKSPERLGKNSRRWIGNFSRRFERVTVETIRLAHRFTTQELILSGILVVDDHPVIARACGLVLEPVGIETIIPAYDADSGYQAFLEHAPDMSVIDLSLRRNELDGIDLIRRIRARDTTARILVFSMRSDRSSFLAAIEAGAT